MARSKRIKFIVVARKSSIEIQTLSKDGEIASTLVEYFMSEDDAVSFLTGLTRAWGMSGTAYSAYVR
jgi:aldehyde:ferredoxin oxidoreductase